MKPLESAGVAGIYLILDGHFYKPKERTSQKSRHGRVEQKAELADLINQLQEARWQEPKNKELREKVIVLMKKLNLPTENVLKTIRSYFLERNSTVVVQAPYEADPQAARMYLDGLVDAVVGPDSDVFFEGADNVIIRHDRR